MLDFDVKLKEIENFPFNWDGYGASIISEKVLDNAINIYKKLFKKSKYLKDLDMYPNPNNAVTFIYDKNKLLFNLEIGIKNYSIYLIKNDLNFCDYGKINNSNIQKLNLLINNLVNI